MLDRLKKLAAEIGMMEIKRKQGIYVPMKEIIAKKNEFRRLSHCYKKV